jgi:hypothetical protein
MLGAQAFIEAIDAIDNGVSQYSSPDLPKYCNQTDLSSRIGWLNPSWNEPADAQAVDVRGGAQYKYYSFLPVRQSRFAKASQLTGEEFLGRLTYYADAWLPARDIVLSALSTRQNVDPSGKILLFEQFAPWKVCLPLLPINQFGLNVWHRSIYLSLRWNSGVLVTFFLYTSYTLMKLAGTGASKLCQSQLEALKAARRFRTHGEACGMTNYLELVELTVVFLCMRQGS